MTANAGAVRLRAAGLGRPARREARALALGVRLHLLTPGTVRAAPAAPGGGPSDPGQVGQRAPGQRDAGLGRLPRQPGGDRRPRAGHGAVRRDHHVHVGRSSPAAAIRSSIRSRRDQRGGGQHRHGRGATTAPPVPRPAAPAGRRAARPVAADRVRCTRGASPRRRRRPGQRQLAPADDDAPADRGLARGRPSPGRRCPAAAAAASVTGRWATQEDSAAAMPARRRGRPRRGSCRRPARRGARAACARPPRGRRPTPRRSRCTQVQPQPRGGQDAAGRRRRRRGGRRRRSGPGAAAAAGRPSPPKRLSVMRSRPRPSSGAQRVRQRGQLQHAGQLGGAQPDGQHVVVPAGGQAHPGRRRRPDRVARGRHVQLGEDVLEVDGRDRVHRVGAQGVPDRRRQLRSAAGRPASAARGPRAPGAARAAR